MQDVQSNITFHTPTISPCFSFVQPVLIRTYSDDTRGSREIQSMGHLVANLRNVAVAGQLHVQRLGSN